MVHLTLHAVHGVMKPKAEEVINKRESVNKNQNKKNKKNSSKRKQKNKETKRIERKPLGVKEEGFSIYICRVIWISSLNLRNLLVRTHKASYYYYYYYPFYLVSRVDIARD